MILSSCVREKEVSEMLKRGRWPAACGTELRDHVSSCRKCGDLVLVTSSFQRARSEAALAAPAGSPGTLWWRAQLRRRNAAVERLGRPVLGAQIFALAINLVLVAGFLVSQARHGLGWLTWLEQFSLANTLRFGDFWPTALLSSGWSLIALIPAMAALALLSGVVVYLASERQ